MDAKTVLLMIAIIHTEAGNFKDTLGNIKNKASQLYKNKYGKDKSWHFLGQDSTEYPGTNEKYLKINKQNWDTYYKCLDAQNENLGNQVSVIPKAIVAYEGDNIRFECRICISPREQEKSDALIWNWAGSTGIHLEPIQFTEYIYESPDDKSLHIYNLHMENTGQYICSLGDSLTAPYFLTIISVSDNETIKVHPYDELSESDGKESGELVDNNLVLATQWGDWSTCSKCDDIGKRHKLGYCFIYSKYYFTGSIFNVKNATQNHKVVNKSVLELFNIFIYGISCNSYILPNSIKQLLKNQNRKNEIMIGYCQVKCPKTEIFIVKDRNGKIIEEANNSAGIYSLLQSLPSLGPTVERKLQYGIKGKTTILSCSGSKNNNSPVQWQIGNKNLIPEIISKESNGRIFISVTDKIHINDARLSDSNIYSCWQQGLLVSTIRLVVEKKNQMNISHHIMLLGVIIVLSTFVYVFIKAFFGKKYAKI